MEVVLAVKSLRPQPRLVRQQNRPNRLHWLNQNSAGRTGRGTSEDWRGSDECADDCTYSRNDGSSLCINDRKKKDRGIERDIEK